MILMQGRDILDFYQVAFKIDIYSKTHSCLLPFSAVLPVDISIQIKISYQVFGRLILNGKPSALATESPHKTVLEIQ